MTVRFHLSALTLYLILDPELCGGAEGMISTTEQAIQGGVTAVQLRAPNWKKRQLVEVGRRLRTLLTPHVIPLIVNDHVDVALAIDADGAHVGQDDLPVADARRILGPHKILGLSTTCAEEHARVPLDLVDYAGLGPVFPTGSKPDASAALGLSALAQALQASPIPCVAIGGIGLGRVAPIRAAGAQGVAVISAICGTKNASYCAAQLRREWEEGV
jgi:thiamine-phosphate pyrophosphorylase